MIDDDDVRDAAFATSGLTGWGALFGLLLVIALAYVACENEKECETKSCPDGQHAKLIKHECLCVSEAK